MVVGSEKLTDRWMNGQIKDKQEDIRKEISSQMSLKLRSPLFKDTLCNV